jgi:glycosyltransferase involved in cell wall biosynthesis
MAVPAQSPANRETLELIPFENTRPTTTPRISVVVPAMNEAKNLPHVLPRIPDVFEVLLVDGGSSDDTIERAVELLPDVRVLRQPGRGKGDALICGFKSARGDIVVMLDADGSARPEEIPAFVEALVAGADFAKGSRFLPTGGSADITRLRSLGNRALTGLVNLFFRSRYSDLCYGYNAFWTDVLDDLALDAHGFEIETQLNLRAVKCGLAVVEIPSWEDDRIHGVSNLNAVRDGLRVLRTILRERFGRKPAEPARTTPRRDAVLDD